MESTEVAEGLTSLGYKIDCKIGEGSFSDVLKCKDRQTGQLVAAKQLKKTFRNANEASQLSELVAMRKLSEHTNLLKMLESHFDPLSGKVTMVFELMDMSLYDLMKTRNRSVPETKGKTYLYQIIKGVDHLHRHGIFHRDIKPENILVKGDTLKISDLGSIKGIFVRHPYTEYISTRWYRSPECLLTTGFYGPKMDVWAIGCVFFELLTLKPLFPGANEIDQIDKINIVLGTPSVHLLNKFKRNKSRNMSVSFQPKQGTGINYMLPLISEGGRDILKQMIEYDPDMRINMSRLINHKYFSAIREKEMFLKLPSNNQLIRNSQEKGPTWRNPALLSILTDENKKRRTKRKVTTKLSGGPTEKLTISCKKRIAVKGVHELSLQHQSFPHHAIESIQSIAGGNGDKNFSKPSNSSFESDQSLSKKAGLKLMKNPAVDHLRAKLKNISCNPILNGPK